MKRKITIVIMITICLALSFIASNCKEKEHKTLYIDSETKAYCDFKKGSWWAYKEEQTGALDTIRVYNYDGRVVSEEDVHLDYEAITMNTIWTSYGHDLTKANPIIRIIADYNRDKNAFVEERYPFHGYSIVFYPIPVVGDKIEIDAGTFISFDALHDSINLVGQNYYMVKKFVVGRGSGKGQKQIFWSKNIGRIRFETFDGEVWNLIGHHVIK